MQAIDLRGIWLSLWANIFPCLLNAKQYHMHWQIQKKADPIASILQISTHGLEYGKGHGQSYTVGHLLNHVYSGSPDCSLMQLPSMQMMLQTEFVSAFISTKWICLMSGLVFLLMLNYITLSLFHAFSFREGNLKSPLILFPFSSSLGSRPGSTFQSGVPNWSSDSVANEALEIAECS